MALPVRWRKRRIKGNGMTTDDLKGKEESFYTVFSLVARLSIKKTPSIRIDEKNFSSTAVRRPHTSAC